MGWLDYYYDDDRREFRHYVDHFYPSLSRWLHEDLTESPENRYFTSHFAWRASLPVLAILYPRPNQNITESNVISATGVAATGKAAIGYPDPSNVVVRVYYQLNTNEPIRAVGTDHWRAENLRLSHTCNVIRAYAVDALNNTSVVEEIHFTFTHSR